MIFVCVFVNVWCDWFSVWALHFWLYRFYLTRSGYLLPAIHPRHLIDTVWEAEITTLFIGHNTRSDERVVRSAIARMTPGVAHSN
jgi:hypothetical protein